MLLAAEERAAARAEKLAEAAAKASQSAASDKAEIVRLKAEVARLTEQLRGSELRIQDAAKTAALEASQHAAEKMLQRYHDGLRDGATLLVRHSPHLRHSVSYAAQAAVGCVATCDE